MNDIKFKKSVFDFDTTKEKAVEINGKTVMVRQSPLDREEAQIVIKTLCESFLLEYQHIGVIVDKEWLTRMASLCVYTDAAYIFNLYNDSDEPEADDQLDKFDKIMYGTPLYAMLVGTQQNPKYFNGIPYTTPLIDVDQYNGILRSIDDTLESSLYFWRAAQKNENT